MIGYIKGEVVFSDGAEVIVLTSSGVGYQIFFNGVLPEGKEIALYISHIVRETAEDLYGFKSLRGKKLFEKLISVKGVGPKSGFSLIGAIGINQILEAITFEDKKLLTKAPGVGQKAAAQIILDLGSKIQKVKMYVDSAPAAQVMDVQPAYHEESIDYSIIDEALEACIQLGFKEEKIKPIARRILDESDVTKSEQLVHLVLKEL